MGRSLAVTTALLVAQVVPVSAQTAAAPPLLYLGVELEHCTEEGGAIAHHNNTGMVICWISTTDCVSKGWKPIHRLSHSGDGLMIWVCRKPRPNPQRATKNSN